MRHFAAISLALGWVRADPCINLWVEIGRNPSVASVIGRGTIQEVLGVSWGCDEKGTGGEAYVCPALEWVGSHFSSPSSDAIRQVACSEAKEILVEKDKVAWASATALGCHFLDVSQLSVAGKGAVVRESQTLVGQCGEDNVTCVNMKWSGTGEAITCAEANHVMVSERAAIRKPTEQLTSAKWDDGQAGTYELSSWLSHFQNFRVVDLPVIPGTHNSAAINYKTDSNSIGRAIASWTPNQALSIAAQLEVGVRFLDLRLHANMRQTGDFKVRISHSVDTDYTLAKVLREVAVFLATQQTEFVIIKLESDSDFPFRTDAEREEVVKILKAAETEQVDVGNSLTVPSIKFVDLPIPTSDSKLHIFHKQLAEALKVLTVAEAAGKVLLLTKAWEIFPGTGERAAMSFLPSANLPTLLADNHGRLSSKMCAICYAWKWNGDRGARYWLQRCMDNFVSRAARERLQGIAVDFTLRGVYSGKYNDMLKYFFNHWNTDAAWLARRRRPIGVLLLNNFDRAAGEQLVKYAQQFKMGQFSEVRVAATKDSNWLGPIGTVARWASGRSRDRNVLAADMEA